MNCLNGTRLNKPQPSSIFLILRLLPLLLLTYAAFGQGVSEWDATGNSLLTGPHRFRQVAYVTNKPSGQISRAVALYGVIDFDGVGGYSIDGLIVDSSSVAGPQPYLFQGEYSLASSGYGMLTSPLVEDAQVYGLAANGVFVGSGTESGINDFFISAATEAGSNAGLQGEYRLASLEFPNLDVSSARSALMTLNAQGNGTFAPEAAAVGYLASGGTQERSQSLSGATYSMSNGKGTLTLPGGLILGGQKILYRAAGGTVVFGGSANGWDFFVGIASAVTPPLYDGLYYQAGLTHDASNYDSNRVILDSYYGVENPRSGQLLGHQRVYLANDIAAYDYTYAEPYTLFPDGSYTGQGGFDRFFVGKDSAARLGFSNGPYLGFNLALQAPPLSGDGVFIHPAGVVNAASFAPFTAGVAPGEMLTLFGANLAPHAEAAATLPLPKTLAGVQVLVNGKPASMVFASPGQVSAIAPFSTEGPIARLQLSNNGTFSKEVTVFVNVGAAGVFSASVNGSGTAAALHPDFSPVTEFNPAVPGESIAFYVTGLGAVNPTAADGAAGPSGPLSLAIDGITASIGGLDAFVQYAGLAPGFAGLYQVNVKIPAGSVNGSAAVAISGSDNYTSQTSVAISGAAAALRDERMQTVTPRRSRRSAGEFPRTPRFRWDGAVIAP